MNQNAPPITHYLRTYYILQWNLFNQDTIGPHSRGCFKYTNVTFGTDEVVLSNFGTDESVLFIEVSSIQRCPDREVPLYIYSYHNYYKLYTI